MDPATIDNPWALLAFLALLGYLTFNSIRTKKHAKEGKEAAQVAALTIEHESKPNSGGSMKDDLNAIRADLGRLDQGQTEILRVQSEQGGRIGHLEDTVERRGTLEKRAAR